MRLLFSQHASASSSAQRQREGAFLQAHDWRPASAQTRQRPAFSLGAPPLTRQQAAASAYACRHVCEPSPAPAAARVRVVARSASELELQQQTPATPASSSSSAAQPPLHPTLRLIQERHLRGGSPGQHADGFKLGLVIEGGGMQGIISGAMCLRLSQLGLRHTFDVVYGASAGAINGAYFVSGQDEGLDVYTEHCIDGRFLDVPKALLPKALHMYWPTSSGSGSSGSWSSGSGSGSWSGDAEDEAAAVAAAASAAEVAARPPMDLKYLLRYVMEYLIPLDWESVISSSLPLKVVASSLDTLESIILEDFTSKDDLVECLTASATIPNFAGLPRQVHGHRCVDAAVFEPVPLSSAIAGGCTHVLVLCSRTAAPCPNTPLSKRARVAKLATSMSKKVVEALVKRMFLNAEYMYDAWRSNNSNVSHIHDALLLGALYSDPEESMEQLGAYVLPLYPSDPRGTNPICQDKQKLLAAREEGCQVVQRLVGLPLSLPEPAGGPA